MLTALAVLGASLVALAIIQAYALRRLKRSLVREARALADREEVVNFLNRFADSMVTTNDARRWMQVVAGHVASAIGARGLCIYTREGGNLQLVVKAGQFPILKSAADGRFTNRLIDDLLQETLTVNASRLGEVVLGNRSIVEHDLAGGDHGEPIESLMAVPMSSDQGAIGVICAINRRVPGAHFNQDDLFLLESLSNQVALGSTLIEVYEELAKQQLMQRDIKLARQIQQSLLPARPPASRRLIIRADNIPAREVSGDFYDFITLDEDNVLVVIADASGKGVPACMLMAMCRSFLRSNALRYKNDLEGLMQQLNNNLFSDTDEQQFITMAMVLVDKRDNTIEYARAGHTELLIRTPKGDVQVISPEGPALGLLPPELEPQFDMFSFSWLPGSSILLFTDGITEALDDRGEEFGLERLIDTWKSVPSSDPDLAMKTILDRVNAFAHASVQYDDQTLVILSRS